MKRYGTLLILLAFFAVGCGEKNPYDTVKVKGVVTVDGVPAADVHVTFNPKSGSDAAGGLTDAKGEYTLTTGAAPIGSGAIAGEYDVTLSKVEIQGVELSMEEYAKKYGNQPPKTIYVIPEKYSNVKTSGLQPVKVEKGGENVFNFDVKSK